MMHDAVSIQDRVSAYLRKLGLGDEALIRRLAAECLQSARRRVAPGSESELLRRSLEEAQRRFNQALGSRLGITGSTTDDERSLAAARAATLLRTRPSPTDALFDGKADGCEWLDEIKQTLPVSTPPESPLDMHECSLRFWW